MDLFHTSRRGLSDGALPVSPQPIPPTEPRAAATGPRGWRPIPTIPKE